MVDASAEAAYMSKVEWRHSESSIALFLYRDDMAAVWWDVWRALLIWESTDIPFLFIKSSDTTRNR